MTAVLESADLTNATTKHEDIPNGSLVDMSKARLKKANFSGVNLAGADLTDAIGYTQAK